MTDYINKVLEFDIPFVLFQNPKLSNEIELNRHIEKLNQLQSLTSEGDFKFKNEITIPTVVKRFKKSIETNSNFIFTIRDLRILTYGITYIDKKNRIELSIFETENELIAVIELLERNWRDGFIFGLLNCCLTHWEHSNQNALFKIHSLLMQKINEYSGLRLGLRFLKENNRFLNLQNGNLLLGNELAIKKINLIEASKYLFNFHKESLYSQNYFSKVILSYFEKRKSELEQILNDLRTVLSWHNTKKTSQILISKIILFCEYENQHLQDVVKEMSLEFVGDPDTVSGWLPHSELSTFEKEEVLKAKEILNKWIISQFINVFFEKCINDDRRKKFWLQYASHISTFKVFGSEYVKYILLRDKRIAQFVEARFKIVGNTNNVSAFFIHVKDYKFIEFSDEGWAFYAYKLNNKNAPEINSNYSKMEEFRNGNLPFLVTINGYNIKTNASEGRLRHADGTMDWEDVFKYWINKNLGINV